MKIGLEIEVPFRFYFPEIHKDFLGVEPFSKFSEQKVREFNKRIEAEEPSVLRKLTEFSKKYGLERGRDKYWEFVFPPMETIDSHKNVISNLIVEKLLPTDIATSLHITISGVTKVEAYAILLLLELRFITSERILSGFGEDGVRLAWNRKGNAGISVKYGVSLLHDKLAFELRTLMVKPTVIGDVLDYLEQLLKSPYIVINMAKAKLKEIDLPFTVWNDEDLVKYSNHLKTTLS